MEDIFNKIYKFYLCKKIDIIMARMLISPNQPMLMIIIVFLNINIRRGSTCLPLKSLTYINIFNGYLYLFAKKIWKRLGNPNIKDWINLLINSSIVSNGKKKTPLILEYNNLYLQKIWKYECIVANYILYFSKYKNILNKNYIKKIKKLVNYYFPIEKYKNINWQKCAIIIAILNPITFISGEPGTGKTFIITKLLIILIKLNNNRLKIKMVALTGKAAVKLIESLWLGVKKLKLNKKQQNCLPTKAVTLHSLLKINYNENMYNNRINLLKFDILIIDESSMINLKIMVDLIKILPKKIKIIFLGDFYQLPPIGPGLIIKDIYKFYKFNYSNKQKKLLKTISGYKNLNKIKKKEIKNNIYIKNNIFNIMDNLCILNKNYRFNLKSKISYLSKIINIGCANNIIKFLKKNKKSEINYISFKSELDYNKFINICIHEYKKYIKLIINKSKPFMILKMFKKFQLLCALRKGPFGVIGLNQYIENILKNKGLIKIIENKNNYIGRPIMIIRNSPHLNLYNGDIGILLKNNKNELFAYFNSFNNNIISIPYSKLPKHETSFAITIHKSQGSEFNHIALILPNKILPILNKELLYTAVTRSKTLLSICANEKIIKYLINNNIEKYSGLIKRIEMLSI